MLAKFSNENALIEGLDEGSFPHEVTGLRVLETHISWIVLTGQFAYKIKKPVRFDFLDYSTRAARKHYCDLEFQLNRRFAPEIYLDVVPIQFIDGQYKVGKDSTIASNSNEPVEHAVKMRQFPQDALVAARLQHSELTGEAVAVFGAYLAKFHDSAEAANPGADCVQVDRIEKGALENFVTLRDAFLDDARSQQLRRLRSWTTEQIGILVPAFQTRLRKGKIRQCHGDLHLKNIIQLDGQLMAFDGIEFNEEFQWIDVLNELAFPVMDFMARGREDLGWRLLNAYLELTGEYQHLDLLRFYLVYRAMVRAKVSWLNPKNRTHLTRSSDYRSSADPQAGPWDKYIAVAAKVAFEIEPTLSITHGFSGSGKSTVAMNIIEESGGVRIRSDVERHRLTESLDAIDRYSARMNSRLYAHLNELASSAIKANFPVIVDATFLKREQRELFENLARELRVGFQIIHCDAPVDELCHRIRDRHGDASEATIDVLRMQMQSYDPLSTEELSLVAPQL